MPTRFKALLAAIVTAVLCVKCSSSSTSLVAPTADKCQVTATTSAGSFTATGGSATVSVSAARDCTWSLAADAPWIAISGPHSGQGDASIPYSVQANPTPSARAGAIVVGSDRLSISQSGAPCRFDLSHSRDGIGAAGGRLSVSVTTLTGCSWTASTGASWITLLSGQSANASAAVALNVAANAGDARVGTVTIAGQTYTVAQDGVASVPPPPTPTPNPPPPTPNPPPPPPQPGPSVDFDGTVGDLAGVCPAVVFSVRGLAVATDVTTDYKHGSCSDLRPGSRVSGSGLVQRDGTIRATSLDVKKGGGND